MQVNPGELNRKIIITKDSQERNENGFVVGREVVRTCCAKYTKRTGSEREGSGTDVNKANIRFLIRYTDKELDTNMQVEYRNNRYNILDINDMGDRHEYIELYCELVVM